MAADFMELVNRRAAEIAEAEVVMMAEHRAKLVSLNRTREQAVATFDELLASAAARLAQARVPTIRTGGQLRFKSAWMVGKPVFRRGNCPAVSTRSRYCSVPEAATFSTP